VEGTTAVGFYGEDAIVSLEAAAHLAGAMLPATNELIDYLPHGRHHAAAKAVAAKLKTAGDAAVRQAALKPADVKLLVPIAHPSKILLLAGNYSEHIEEGGGLAAERQQTFPYVFMKPPLTTLTNPGDPIRIPAVSPNQIDWELELGVVIGKTCKGVAEKDALGYVAGYTVVNDVSDRAFQPNPSRIERPNNKYFDWLHGKWHDTFCPMGPCVLSADDVPNPQKLKLTLKVNGNVEQDSSTAQMIFPVAGVIEFISSFVTLSPGDVIATGTPAGVGKAKGKFLKAGDLVEAEIGGIGILRNPVE
jgi:2-keto-4-pentenoate hydratase/2-oxohepta-3-ene-1,7-dioic acid hydratase in catechol pathway